MTKVGPMVFRADASCCVVLGKSLLCNGDVGARRAHCGEAPWLNPSVGSHPPLPLCVGLGILNEEACLIENFSPPPPPCMLALSSILGSIATFRHRVKKEVPDWGAAISTDVGTGDIRKGAATPRDST